MPSEKGLKAEIERLPAENEKRKKPERGRISLKVSEKGALSVYGLGRFPVTLYREQWEKLLALLPISESSKEIPAEKKADRQALSPSLRSSESA